MYLLKTDTYELVEVSGKTPRHAILSHRWEQKEITFGTINPNALRNGSLASFEADIRPSATKIIGACTLARQQLFDYIWIDTCCIDKSRPEEVVTSINSMFKWYRRADICYTYLNDVVFSKVNANMFNSIHKNRRGRVSEWFERGWTLQELLAPQKMEFYDMNWGRMGTRDDLADMVGRVAGIAPAYLKDCGRGGNEHLDFREASVATKMSWMAGRNTKFVEDIAYSLLGIFNVNLIPIYGEGTKAFTRLQYAILMENGPFDESLFAWQHPKDGILQCYYDSITAPKFAENQWGLLAPSPDCFKDSANVAIVRNKIEPRRAGCFQRCNQGIFVTLRREEVINKLGVARSDISLPLNCWRVRDGQPPETIVLRISRDSKRGYFRAQCNRLSSEKDARINSGRVPGPDRDGSTFIIPQPQVEIY